MSNISFGSFNLYNIQKPGRFVYGRKVAQETYDAKKDWTADMLCDLDADVIGFQELWQDSWCLEDVFKEAKARGLKGDYAFHYIKKKWGGIGVAAAVRKPWIVTAAEPVKAFPPECKIIKRRKKAADDKDREDDEVDLKINRFSRTLLKLRIKHETRNLPPITVICAHLKAKLPTALDKTEQNKSAIAAHSDAIGAAISTIRRTAEATALRVLLNKTMRGNRTPVVLMGDMNDGLLSNTLSILTAQPPYELFLAKRLSKAKAVVNRRDLGLYSTAMLQQFHSLRDVYYSHNYRGVLEILDHILVSEEFYEHSPHRKWAMRQMRIWSDHVDEHDPRERDPDKSMSDHGVVKAEFEYNSAS